MADRSIRIILSTDSLGAVKGFEAVTVAATETAAATDKAQGSIARGIAATNQHLAGMKSAGQTLKGTGRAMTTMAVPLLAVGGYAVKTASDFQTAMTLIRTQAHQSQREVNSMSTAILRLAPSLGTSTAALADSLYHIESAGFHGSQALKLMSIAAKEAQVSGANLTDTTTALTASVFSGIKGAQNYTQAMGLLNATVGAGDMHFQDLNEAFAGPMLATVKGYGVSLKDVGAALATFGDLNIRGADAATQFRMAVQYMARPASTAGPLLQQLGLNTQSFANAMAKGGLLPALQLLHDRLDAAGVKGNNVAGVISQLFTKKGAAGVTILENSLAKLESKYPIVAAGAGSLPADFAARTQNIGFQWDKLKASAQVALIGIGNALMPIVQQWLPKLASAVAAVAHWFKNLPQPVQEVVMYLTAFLAIGGPIIWMVGNLITIVAALGTAFTFLAANPVVAVIAGIALLVTGLVIAYHKVGWFRDLVNGVFHGIAAVVHVTVTAITTRWTALVHILAGPFQAAWAVIKGILDNIKTAVHTITHPWEVAALPVTGTAHVKPGYTVRNGQVIPTGSASRPGGFHSSTVGAQRNNSVNQTGSASVGDSIGGASIVLHHKTMLGSRVLTEETVHYAQRKAALGGAVSVG